MTLLRLARRGLAKHAVSWGLTAVCLAVANSVVVGSLLVGDSFRTKLRLDAEAALGKVQSAVVAPQFFRASLATGDTEAVIDLTATASVDDGVFVPGITLRGEAHPSAGDAIISARVAKELNLKVGDLVFLDVPKPDLSGAGTVFARRQLNDTSTAIRVKVKAIAPMEEKVVPLSATTAPVRWVKVNREWLAAQLGQSGKANALLSPGTSIAANWTPEDLGLKMTPSEQGVMLHTKRLLFPLSVLKNTPPEMRSATALAVAVHGPKSIYYAVVATDPHLTGNEAAVNAWAAEDLGVRGDEKIDVVTLDAKPDGTYGQITSALRVSRILPMNGQGVDRAVPPDFEGMSNAVKITDWNPPFPVNLKQVTDRDEAYWKAYRAAPKLYVSPQAMRQMWQGKDVCTGLRFASTEAAEKYVKSVPLTDWGVRSLDVRAEMLKAARGASDLSMLLMMLGIFLVASAATVAGSIVALLVRRRASEWALLRALGMPTRRIFSLLMMEAALPMLAGAGLSTLGGMAFASYALRPLSGAWEDVSIPLVVHPATVVSGVVMAIFVSALAVGLAFRGLRKLQPVVVLRSGVEIARFRPTRPVALLFSVCTFIGAIAGGFYNEAFRFMALLAGLVVINLSLGSFRRSPWLGFALARGRKRPILLQVSLLASATFIVGIVASHSAKPDRAGTAGFDLIATSTTPLPIGFDTPAGRQNLGFTAEDEPLFKDVMVLSLKRSNGDDTSCLNPNLPVSPRMLAAPSELLGALPGKIRLTSGQEPMMATADAETVQWVLESGTGKEMSFPKFRVRFGPLLPPNVLSGYLFVSPKDFEGTFPEVHDPSLFLIRTAQPQQVAKALRRNLGRAGLEVKSTQRVMEDLEASKAVYLSMFASLGTMGLLFAALGSAAIALRNAFDRRRELALLSALGFTDRRTRSWVALETGMASFVGVLLGCVCAFAPLWGLMLGVTTLSFFAAFGVAFLGRKESVVGVLRSE